MTDYSSWKVTELKAELKKRGIPGTGLRLKQHFVDKLAEEDAKVSTDDAAPADHAEQQTTEEPSPVAESTDQQQPEEQQPDLPPQEPATKEQPAVEPPQAQESQEEQELDKQTNGNEGQVEAATAATASEEPSKSKLVEQDAGDVQKEPREELAQPLDTSVPSLAPTSEANTELSTPLPIEEALEDKRKRKRRSQSPVPTPEAIAAKKARAEEEGPRIILEDKAPSAQETEPTQEPAQEPSQGEQKAVESSLPTSAPKPPTPVKQDARFRGLFAEAAPTQEPSPPQDVVMEDADVEPALHAATSALYIDGLMRPLQPPALRNHLANLASAPGAPTDREAIQEYYLDPIKTHCFVRFRDVQSASRVRSSLHGKIWPNERNRKNLWADFIPDEKIQEWIQTEESSRNRAGPPVRWEVRYDTTDDGTKATLSEAGPNSRSVPAKPHPSGIDGAPLGPRGSFSQPPSAPPAPPSRPGQGFKPLDELFKSTTAKPKLYYMPVARDIADKRLDQFDELLRKGSCPRRGGDEMRRITFEEENEFVDIGPEYGPAAAQRRQERAGRGGRGRNWRGR